MCRRHRRAVDERPPELLSQLGVESAACRGSAVGELDVVVEIGAPGQIEGHFDERLVERHRDRGEPTHAGLGTESLGESLAEHDADVLDGVVRVDLEIAGRLRRG